MELFSLQFLLFVLVLVAAHRLAGRVCLRYQWVVLLAASLAFYLIEASLAALALMVGAAFVGWTCARVFRRLDEQCKEQRGHASTRAAKKQVKERFARRRRLVLAAALLANLGVLGYFKYWNTLLSYARLASDPHSLGIVLPLGISFYTFQSLGYVIQSYNGAYPPQQSFARYLLFVTYFPQVLQGPINRYDHLMPQLEAPGVPGWDQTRRALLRLGLGLLKKLAVANTLSGVVFRIFDEVDPGFPGMLALWGVFLYSLQIYGDFSGGIDMVEGVSELVGVRMDENFRQPYFSVSLAEFWRRWHMSLGAFMRDFVFYPLAVSKPLRSFGKWCRTHLGKERGRTLPAGVCNVVVFVLVGLWHGAEPHFVAWGIYNGLIIAASDVLEPTFERLAQRVHLDRGCTPWRLFAMARTFFIVMLGRYLDYLTSLRQGLICLRNTFFNFAPGSLTDALYNAHAVWVVYLGLVPPTVAALLVILAVDVAAERGMDVRERILALPYPVRVTLYAGVAVIIAFAFNFDTTSGGGQFLYANF